MRFFAVAALLAAAACGRVGYQATGDAGDGSPARDSAGSADRRPGANPPLPDTNAPPADTNPPPPDTNPPPPDTNPPPPDTSPAGAFLCTARKDALACWDYDRPDAPLPGSAGGTTAVRDTTMFVAGSASMRLTADGRRSGVIASDASLAAAVTSGSLYLRAFFRLPASIVIRDWVVLLEAKSGSSGVSLQLSPDDTMSLHASSATAVGGLAKVPRDRWFCVELAIDVDPTAGRARLSVDGTMILQHTGIDTQFGRGLNFVRGGLVLGPQNTLFELSVDEFLVSRTPIGCQ